MASVYTARAAAVTALNDTELANLGIGAKCAASAAQSNEGSGERAILAQFELYLAAQGTNRAAGANVALYIIPEVSGTYADVTDECLDNYFAGSWSLDDAALAARYAVLVATLPPSDFKLVVGNNTGQTFAPTGSTVAYRTFGYEDV